jgi:hypothetical protein
MALIGLLQLAGTIWVIYSVINRPDKSSENRLIWIIAAILFGIVTAIVYYLLEHNKLNNNNDF